MVVKNLFFSNRLLFLAPTLFIFSLLVLPQPVAAANTFDVSYLWHGSLNGVKDYRKKVGRILGPNATKRLKIVKKDKLYFTSGGEPGNHLRFLKQDEFAGERFKIIFLRDNDKRVSAFTMNTGRVKNLKFVKKK